VNREELFLDSSELGTKIATRARQRRRQNGEQIRSPKLSSPQARRDGKTDELLGLAQECFEIVVEVLSDLGMSRTEIIAATKRARRSRTRTRPSARTLARYTQAGHLLNYWRRNKRYIGPEGAPRVIPIYGKGATFETLARKFAPDVPVGDFVNFICRYGDATRPNKNTLALVGSNVFIYEKKPEITLAALNENFRNLAGTLSKNKDLPPELRGGGLFQRIVNGFVEERAFRKFARDIRPQLQDLCDFVESTVDNGVGLRSPKRRYCGMSIFLFQD